MIVGGNECRQGTLKPALQPLTTILGGVGLYGKSPGLETGIVDLELLHVMKKG